MLNNQEPNAGNQSASGPSSPSRRLLLKLLGLGAAMQGGNALGQIRTCPEDANWLITTAGNYLDAINLVIYRPQDMLRLELTFINFELTSNAVPGLRRRSSGAAYLVVNFQPQSLAEEAYPETDDAIKAGKITHGAQSYLSGASRLVYEIPSSIQQIALTAEELLNWERFSIRVNKRAFAPNLLKWTLDDDKPVQQVKPVLPNGNNIHIQVDSTHVQQRNPVLRQTEPQQPVNQRQVTQPVQQQGNRPIRILQTTPKDSTVTRRVNANQANRVATKDEQQQMVITQLPKDEVVRQTQLNEGGIVASFQNITQGKTPRPPDYLETSIEMPWRLMLSPSNIEGFAHSHQLKLYDLLKDKNLQVYELWHTRLAAKNEKGQLDESESKQAQLSMRAMWGVDICADPMSKPDRNFKPDNKQKLPQFTTAMYNDDRHCIVHESSNWAISNYTPKAIKVHRMMMSALGAWLDSEFDVDRKDLEKGKVNGRLAFEKLNLVKWSHIATMARDHYVEIVYAGNIFPFGHEASLVRITERKPIDGYAANLQRTFIVINEPEKKYNPYAKNNTFLSMPLRSIRLLTTITPTLDPPKGFVPEAGMGDAQLQFVPKVNGKEFKFKCTAIDPEGNEVNFEMPVVFVAPDIFLNQKSLKKVISWYNGYNIDNPNQSMASPVTTSAPLRGQKVAVAESFVPGDTTYESETIRFAANLCSDELQGFLPGIGGLSIHEPSYQALTGTRDSIDIKLVDDRQSGNTAQVFAKVLYSAAVNFAGNTDKTGGGVAPNFNLSGLSKLQGAFAGDIDSMKNFSVNPKDFFPADNALEAKLFGVFKLSDLVKFPGMSGLSSYVNTINKAVDEIRAIQSQVAALIEQGKNADAENLKKQLLDKSADLVSNKIKAYQAKIPVLKTIDLPGEICTQYQWKAEADTLNIPSSGTPFVSFVPKDKPNTIKIDTMIRRPKGGGGLPVFSTSSSINSFNITLANIIAVNFKKISFAVDTNAKVDVNVEMEKNAMEFLGPLKFINGLKDLIPSDGFSDPPFLDVTTSGVKAGYTLAVPDVSLGAFVFRNISMGAVVNLPFTGAPLTMGFNFCERHQPFTITVAALGGGGFFGVEFDLKGLRTLEVSLEFGAAVAINLGVASGAVSIMAGIYFKMKFETDHSIIELSGYVRINGALSVLGLITASVEFYMALTYNFSTDKCWGEASLKVKVEVLFFSKTVTLTTRREFKGSGADPTFRMTTSEQEWLDYCAAFAA